MALALALAAVAAVAVWTGIPSASINDDAQPSESILNEDGGAKIFLMALSAAAR